MNIYCIISSFLIHVTKFIAISEDEDGVRIILSQPYIANQFMIPTDMLINRYLTEGLNLKKEDKVSSGNKPVSLP